MRICENCNKRYKDTANFCVFCGAPLFHQGEVTNLPRRSEMTVHISYMISDNEQIETCKELPALLGRDSSNVDIPLLHPSVSRKHCRIFLQGQSLLIEDVGSSNGTFINGQRISGAMPITDDDEIVIGKIKVSIWVDSTTSIEEG